MANERPKYEPSAIEPKWQKRWSEERTFEARRHPGRPKKYILDMFPYPSGAGLHVGHPEGYTATDIVARHARMKGIDVLHPMGWDSFGLPAEQYAIKTGTHPAVTTAKNIETFKRQLQSLGFSYDWSRELATTDVDYVRWTQWIFLKLFERGLAYQADFPVNGGPALGTPLANEEVVDGKSEVGGHPVVRLPLRQWTLKITAYADRLASELENLDWPETKKKQIDWIGRSEGAEVDFGIESRSENIRIFTTRPDTLFGATYMVLAPEHKLVGSLTTDAQRAAVEAYQSEVASKSDMDRTALAKHKTGVFTGSYATHPLTGDKLPIWIADFVLGGYGTGAIMSVPAHDERDFEFAKQFGLPIVQVVSKDGSLEDAMAWKAAQTEDGVAVRSRFLDGKKTADAKAAMIDHLEREKLGVRKVQYKLRDWVFSRQRYWGEPIPIYFPVDLEAGVTDPRKGAHTIRYDQPRALTAEELPLKLPELTDFSAGDPQGALIRAADWRFFEKDGQWFARETNTMPQWAGSCWYYLRYIDPKNAEQLFSQEAYDAWMPVDLYVGGNEHAVLHLLYARFWHKVLFDAGIVKDPEPFMKLVHQGMILGESVYVQLRDQKGQLVSYERAYQSDVGAYKLRDDDSHLEVETFSDEDFAARVTAGEFEKKGGNWHRTDDPTIRVGSVAMKMSKSRGNVVNPDDIVRDHGADSLRVYEMFMGPLEATKPWQTNGVIGVRRFLDRAWNVMVEAGEGALDDETNRLLHKTIKKVGEDIEALRFNTAISAMMILSNRFAEAKEVPKEAAEKFALILSPFAPHLAEEIWERLGHTKSLAYEPWPAFDPALTVDDEVEMAVQVNGKVRSKVRLRRDATEADARAAIANDEAVLAWTKGKTEKKFLFVPGRIINVVVA
ncbi:MAG: leucine--tRNA ligase [Polyangiales bacterium]